MLGFYSYISMRGISNGIFFSLWIIFFKDVGLNLFHIGLIGAILEISRMIFEIPTGSFADKYGRKISLVGAALIYTLSLAIFTVANVPWHAYLAAFIFGLGDSFRSGAYEAWLMDYLKGRGQEGKFKANITNAYILFYLFCIISSIFAGHVYKISRYSILYISITANLIALLSCIFMPEVLALDEKRKKLNFRMHFIESIKESYHLIKSNKNLSLFFFAGAALAFGIDGIERYYQPFLQNIGFSSIQIAYLYTISSIMGIIMLFLDKVSSRILKYNDLTVLILSQGIIFFIVLTISVYSMTVSYYLIIIFFGLNYVLRPSVQNYLNQRIPSSIRATALSSYELVGAGGEISSGFILGALAHKCGINTGFFFAGLVIMVSCFILVRLKRRYVEYAS
ncbi:MAG: MFS transporter [Pseudomonadota bacterium]